MRVMSPRRAPATGATPLRRHSAQGMIQLKTLLALLLLGVAGYVLFKVTPPYFANSQLKDKMWEEARFAEANDRTAEQVRANILRAALQLEIPLEADNIQVEMGPTGTRITADYSVIVDLYYYQLHWDFHTTSAR